MFNAIIGIYPWDLFHEGVETVLDRLQGDIGATAVSLIVGGGKILRLRPGNVEPRVVRVPAGIYFEPNWALYRGCKLRPAAARAGWVQMGWDKIAEACRASGMAFHVTLSMRCLSSLARSYPEAACTNVLGDVSRTALCTLAPDVNHLLGSLIQDIVMRTNIDSFLIQHAEPGWSEASSITANSGAPMRRFLRRILSICFCASCRETAARAGIGVNNATSVAVEAIDLEESGTSSDALATGSALHQYLVAQETAVERTLKAIADRLERPILRAHANNSVDTPSTAPFLLSALEIYRLGGSRLVEVMESKSRAGATSVCIYDYGALSEKMLSDVRKAIRFARRTSGG